MRRRTNRTPEKREAFLAVLREGYSIYKAADTAKMSRRSAYDWREADEDFARDWDSAVEAGTDALEDVLHLRASDKDTTAAIFLLKGRRPEKYRDRVDQTLSGAVTVKVVQFGNSDPE